MDVRLSTERAGTEKKSNSVSGNIIRSTFASLANQLVRAGQQLLWAPLFLATLGKKGYGEWLTLFSLASYVAMSDAAVQVHWLNLLTGANVQGDSDMYRRLFRAGLSLFGMVGIPIIVGALIFTSLSGVPQVLDLSRMNSGVASTTLIILMIANLATVLSRMLRNVYRTVGQYPKVLWFAVSHESLTLATVAGALLIGIGPLGLARVYAVNASVMLIWAGLGVWRRFPHLVDFRLYRSDRPTLALLAQGGAIYFTGVLANLLLTQGTLIITNWALGAAAVALVSLSRTLANFVRQVATSVYLATLPEFSRLEAAGNHPEMERLLRRSVTFGLSISGLACLTLVAIGPTLFDLWTAGRFPEAPPLLYLFLTSVMVDACRLPFVYFLNGCNKITYASLTEISFAVSSLIGMCMLFRSSGAWAVPLATAVCGLVVHLPCGLLFSARIIRNNLVRQLLAKIAWGLLSALVCGGAMLLFKRAASGPIVLVVVNGVSVLTFGVVAWRVLLDRTDVLALGSRLGGFLRWAGQASR